MPDYKFLDGKPCDESVTEASNSNETKFRKNIKRYITKQKNEHEVVDVEVYPPSMIAKFAFRTKAGDFS